MEEGERVETGSEWASTSEWARTRKREGGERDSGPGPHTQYSKEMLWQAHEDVHITSPQPQFPPLENGNCNATPQSDDENKMSWLTRWVQGTEPMPLTMLPTFICTAMYPPGYVKESWLAPYRCILINVTLICLIRKVVSSSFPWRCYLWITQWPLLGSLRVPGVVPRMHLVRACAGHVLRRCN